MPYRPTACKKTYRLVVVRKNLTVEKGEIRLFDDYRYFFYLTNDWDRPAAEIVFDANQRCNQENLHAQLKGGVRALQAPVDTLESNWAYMVMTSLAWNLKAWFALWPTETSGPLAGAASSREADGAGDGVQDVRERVPADAVPDRPHGSSPDLSAVELESVATALLPHAGAIALLTSSY